MMASKSFEHCLVFVFIFLFAFNRAIAIKKVPVTCFSIICFHYTSVNKSTVPPLLNFDVCFRKQIEGSNIH